ncbi:hypothetical protein LDENG_00093090 [Lucifuga dentata]|nr:hypothetical protein LDENG_00093090 [Lucifuga dentata]
MTVVQDQKDMSLDLPFLQLRASLPFYSQPVRPYTLLTNAEDHHIPKPKHLRASRLLRVLGSSFNPFWMSIEQPANISGIWTSERNHNLREAATNLRWKLEKEAADVDLSSLPSDVASSVRDWLVRSATCGLRYQWVDLGPAFWPRWLRQTDCVKSNERQSCSFPSGMECMRAETMHIQILAWHCLESRDGRTGEAMKKCLWRQVPYPVVTVCKCSCK